MGFQRRMRKILAVLIIVVFFCFCNRKEAVVQDNVVDDVVVIFDNWLNAMREDSGAMTDSYRILDLDTPFIKELQLRAIPRYLIIDASGQLVDVDADRPSSKGIAQTLSALL